MAFGGLGPAAALIDADSIRAPGGVYASQPNGPVSGVAADDIFWQATEVERRSQLNELYIRSNNAALLAARIGTPNPAAADTGQLVSDEAAANQHGLPANFGPGRGNWILDDIRKVVVSFQFLSDAAQGGAGETPLVSWGVLFSGGDIQITLHNYGGQATDVFTDLTILYIP